MSALYNKTLDVDEVADCLLAMGNPTRLSIIRILMRRGDLGLTVGEIQDRLTIAASTLTHHLKHLENEGLITREKEKAKIICKLRFGRIEDILAYLAEECCVENPNQGHRPLSPRITDQAE